MYYKILQLYWMHTKTQLQSLWKHISIGQFCVWDQISRILKTFCCRAKLDDSDHIRNSLNLGYDISEISIIFYVSFDIFISLFFHRFFLSKQIKQIGKVAFHVIQIVIKIDHISAICHCFYIKLHEIQRTKYIVCQK